jgi:hypothetical protein
MYEGTVEGRAKTPATEKQVAYICGLLDKKDLSGIRHMPPDFVERRKEEARTKLTKGIASRWIEELKALPDNSGPEPDSAVRYGGLAVGVIPDGRYAIEDEGVLKFYKVKNGHSRVFVDVRASDDWHPLTRVESRNRVVTAISEDPKAASIRYGKELGRCGVCGRTLTDEHSRRAGIGPICAGRSGWALRPGTPEGMTDDEWANERFGFHGEDA